MNKLHLVPAIHLEGGFARIVDHGTGESNFTDPVDLAVELEELGFDELLLIDIDGARSGNFNSFDVLSEMVSFIQSDILVGGGVRNESSVEKIFSTGASRVLLNSLPVTDQEKMLNLIDIYGNNSFVIGVDLNNEGIVIEGRSKNDPMALEQLIGFYTDCGIDRFILQGVDEAGVKTHPDALFLDNVKDAFPRIRLYAGEGINDPSKFEQFEKAGLTGMVIGDEFYTSAELFQGLRNYLYG